MTKKREIKNEDLHYLMQLVKSSDDDVLEIEFKKGSEIYKNALNLKILQRIAESKGKEIKFEVENKAHKDYIDAVNGDKVEFNDSEMDLDANFARKPPEEYVDKGEIIRRRVKLIVIPVLVLGSIVAVFGALWWYIPTAIVKIATDTKGLVKLFNVKVSTEFEQVSVEEMTIPGFLVNVTETDSQTIPTTGKKEVGEKASGEVTITNKTDNNVKLKNGTILKLISSDEES